MSHFKHILPSIQGGLNNNQKSDFLIILFKFMHVYISRKLFMKEFTKTRF